MEGWQMSRWNPRNWFKPQKAPIAAQAEPRENWGDYAGEGIWWICPDCNSPHEVKDQAFFEHVQNACEEISDSTRKLYEDFGFLDSGGRWDIDPDNGIFIKTTAEGRKASGKYGVVGSWNEKTHSWLWSWQMDNSWMPQAATIAAQELKKRGEKEDWIITSASHLLLNEHETWHITNLAAKAAGFSAAYRAKVNDINHHFFIINQLEWEPMQ
jgi:hypothetical protein